MNGIPLVTGDCKSQQGPGRMRVSKAGYYADFFIYPPFLLALLVGVAVQAGVLAWIYFSIACLIGVASWTLLEYVIHRQLLHRIRFLSTCMRFTTIARPTLWALRAG